MLSSGVEVDLSLVWTSASMSSVPLAVKTNDSLTLPSFDGSFSIGDTCNKRTSTLESSVEKKRRVQEGFVLEHLL